MDGEQRDISTGVDININRSEFVRAGKDRDESSFCTSCLFGIWGTGQSSGTSNRDAYIKTTIRELIVYILYISVLCVLTFGMTNSDMYYMTKAISDTFVDKSVEDKSFKDIVTHDDIWNVVYLETVAIENLFGGRQAGPNERYVLYENKLLGYPRLRQIRVKNDSCEVADDFKNAINVCYDVYSPSAEDERPFSDNNTGETDASAWEYQTGEDLENMIYFGKLATYSGGGAVQDLNGDSVEKNKKIIDALKQKVWLQRGTRVLFFDFTVYNANINLFCIVKLVMEMPPTGGVIPSSSLRTVRLIRYIDDFDYFVLGCEIMFCLFLVYYIIEEIVELMRMGCKYFKMFWTYIDLTAIILSLIYIGFSAYRTLEVNSVLGDLLADPTQFPDFDLLGFWQLQNNNVLALIVFVSWIKIFKYISFNRTMTQLSSTLRRSSKDVGGFSVMFCIVFFAYAQLGYLLFGTQIEDFSSLFNASFTLLRTILGDFNFLDIQHANRLLGPIFFITYVFFVYFVLLNMFLAIINDTYSEVKGELSQEAGQLELGDFLKRCLTNVLRKFGKHDRVYDLATLLRQLNDSDDQYLTYEQVRQNLKANNFTDSEIDLIFSKYDRDHDRMLDPNEAHRMLAELEGDKNQAAADDSEVQNDAPKIGIGDAEPGVAVNDFTL
uniref:EF-hand domain-containing protein n=1 Tax=Strigamia maritima TaxID=126957 RepID=T1INT4_STRMM